MNSKNYWKRRALLLEQLLNTRADATVQQISRLYGLAQEQIFQQIEKVFSSYVRGGALNPDKAMQLLTVRETEEARALLLEQYQRATGQVKRDIWARLSAPAYANRIERLQALRDSLYIQARMVGLDEVSYVRDRLSDTLEQSYYRTTFDIQQYTGEGYDFSLLNDNQITAALAADWSGKNWSERLWDNNQRFADAVEDTVTVGIMAGLRYDEMRDNLLHVIGMDETEGAKYRAARLVKTECAYIANQGHLLGYQAAEIERYIFLATLDLRTSEVCRSLDMKRFSVAEAQAGENLPPMHPHCRSTTMPDMTDEQLRKVSRAARDPATGKGITVPGDMKYRDWYKKFVEGHPQAQAREKAVKNKAADREQFRRYRAVLGENAPKTLEEFQRMKYTGGEKWAVLRQDIKTELGRREIVSALAKGPSSDDFGAVVRKNHHGLRAYSPAEMKAALARSGFDVKPLSRGNFKGVPFEQGGGYKTNYGGNGIFQYHPESRSHHGGAYWKVRDTKGGNRYDMEGNAI